MHVQFLIVLGLAILAAGFLLRDFAKVSSGNDCASGCGACRSRTCGQGKLARITLQEPKR